MKTSCGKFLNLADVIIPTIVSWILKPGFAADFYFGHYRGLKLKTSCGKFLNLAHYFPYDVNLRLLAHSWSFLANQKARNAIVGAENLLIRTSGIPLIY